MTTNSEIKAKETPLKETEDEDDIDTVLASLEEEDDSKYQSQRAQELSADLKSSKSQAGYAKIDSAYITLKSDDDVLRFTTEHERAVVHFFHPDFARCNIMDRHCQLIATKHSEFADADVSFARVDVKDSGFVVEKLNVRVLPCVIGFVKGIVKGRVTGFEGICWDGKEGAMSVARSLERTLFSWNIVKKTLLHADEDEDDTDDEDQYPKRQHNSRRGIRSGKHEANDEDDGWD